MISGFRDDLLNKYIYIIYIYMIIYIIYIYGVVYIILRKVRPYSFFLGGAFF